MTTLAQYHGTCAECEDDILPGERITSIDGEWVHQDCEARPEKAVCACATCWTVHAGECV